MFSSYHIGPGVSRLRTDSSGMMRLAECVLIEKTSVISLRRRHHTVSFPLLRKGREAR
jgi:hypothetical protein